MNVQYASRAEMIADAYDWAKSAGAWNESREMFDVHVLVWPDWRIREAIGNWKADIIAVLGGDPFKGLAS